MDILGCGLCTYDVVNIIFVDIILVIMIILSSMYGMQRLVWIGFGLSSHRESENPFCHCSKQQDIRHWLNAIEASRYAGIPFCSIFLFYFIDGACFCLSLQHTDFDI